MEQAGILDLVIVNPGNRTQIYQGLGDELAAIEPPIWVGLIASYARRRHLSVVVIDANAEGLTPDAVAKRVGDLAPRLCVVVVYGHNPSASTQVMPSAGAVCAAIKTLESTQKVLLLGGHVAALPERTLREEQADYVCGGEGPVTVADLVEALRTSSLPELRKVRDLWYREGTEVVRTSAAPLVQALDREMPTLAWDLLPMERYRAHNWHCFDHPDARQPYAALYTTLGCPFHCSFCCIQAPFKRGEQALNFRDNLNSYRYWSPESVLAQIDVLVTRYGIRNIKFGDEMFVLNRKHVTAICRGLIERRYDLNIWAYARVDTVADGMADLLRQAGVTWLAFGIEAANEKVRDDVDKGFSQQAIYQALERVRAAGIAVVGNYIFGLPEDNLDSMQETLTLACSLNAEFANFYCTMAYPGSSLYTQAAQQGWALPQSWSGYSQHAVDCTPLPTKHLSARQVLEFRDRAFQTYFSQPAYLAMIKAKYGEAVVAHIQSMNRHRLVRNTPVHASHAAHIETRSKVAPAGLVTIHRGAA